MDFLFKQLFKIEQMTSKHADYLNCLITELHKHGVEMSVEGRTLIFSKDAKSLSFYLADETCEIENHKQQAILSLDYLVTSPEKITAIILSKLHLNKTVFARNCDVKKIDKNTATAFLDTYHLMGSTQSGFNMGLIYKAELVALASFSKGRKMNRLESDKRSFELIRFCSKSGVTITGGLTKLLKNFYIEKQAGDIMTYADKQLSNGSAFIRAGFVKHSDIAPNYFLINRRTFQREILKDKDAIFDSDKFYRTQNLGSLKLIYS